MTRTLPARWRAPALLIIAALIALVVGGASHGWNTVLYIIPIPLVVGTFLLAMAGRESDYSAALRGETDERQALQRLKIQALAGRVLSLAIASAYIIAIVTKTARWPSAILLAFVAASFIAGHLVYGESWAGRAKTPEGG